MSGSFSVILSFIVFTVLVLIHEYGHFIIARKNGILVEEFAIGMGPIILKKQKGDTLYTIRLLPLGGFCRMLGEDSADSDERSFNNKSTWARMAVVVMGPVMNFIFSFIIVFALAASAKAMIFPIVSDYVEGSNAQISGLEIGDKIIKIDGEGIGTYQELFLVLDGTKGKKLDVIVERDGKKHNLSIQPVRSSDNRWLIGFKPTIKTGLFAPVADGFEKVELGETLLDSVYTMRYYIKSVVIGFVRLFTFNISPEEIAGPIGIVQLMGETVNDGLQESVSSGIRSLMTIAALLSTNLGAINLFPIPAMDGGRLVFLAIETVRGKGIDGNKEGAIHFIGFVLLMVFMAIIASNDILRLIKG